MSTADEILDHRPAAIAFGPPPPSPRRSTMGGLLGSLDSALGPTLECKVILFSSARPKEGKTTVIREFVNLLCENADHRIVVVDAGLRDDLSRWVGAPRTVEFRGLMATATDEAACARMCKVLRGVIVARLEPSDVSEGGADLDASTFDPLRRIAHYVLIEMPSLADSPLPLVAAKYIDGVVLVIEAGQTRYPIVQNAKEHFERAGGHVLGAFLNRRSFPIPRRLYKHL
jgi:Mrp family chromosome partitioning ATPase